MLLADAHAHLEFFGDEIDSVMERAQSAGIKSILTAGIDVKTNRKALQLAQQFDIVSAALGLYPIEALTMSEEEIDAELAFIKAQKIAAIGEIGLDYQETEDKQRQQRIFERQLALATELSLPVVVHSRKAEKEVIATLKRAGQKSVVLHAFHGSIKLVKEAVDAGFYLTVTANVTRSDHMQQLVKTAPLSHLLTETDAPFMGPEKGRQSEPAHIAGTIQKIAQIKGMEAAEVANIIYNNYRQLLG